MLALCLDRRRLRTSLPLELNLVNSRHQVWHYKIKASRPGYSMEQNLQALKSTTFGGRRFTRKQLLHIQTTVATFSNLWNGKTFPDTFLSSF